MIYIFVETAKTNETNVYAYPQCLLDNRADGDWHIEPSVRDMLVSWLEEAKEQCKE